VEAQLIVEVLREMDGDGMILPIDERIEKGDIVRVLSSGIAKSYGELSAIGAISKELDVKLSLHSPYYIELTGSEGNELTEKSVESIRWGGLLNHVMGGNMIVTHLGLYEDQTPKVAMNNVIDNLSFIQDWYEDNKLDVNIGVETSGKQEIFGTLEEILALTKKLKVCPVINFAHVHARGGGCLKEKEDFSELIEKTLAASKDKFLYTHFSGVEHEGGNEIRLGPIKKGDLKFETLADAMLDGQYDMTVISSSPLLEHDAMYMKVIIERGLSRHLAKQARKEKSQKEKNDVEKESEKPAPKKVPAKPKKTAPKKKDKSAPKSKSASKKPAAKKPAASKKSAAKKAAPKKSKKK
jgi:deoxyribonuclease-4